MPPARPRTVISPEITRVAGRRQVLIEARDRRNQDMLDALHDVESHEQRIANLKRPDRRADRRARPRRPRPGRRVTRALSFT